MEIMFDFIEEKISILRLKNFIKFIFKIKKSLNGQFRRPYSDYSYKEYLLFRIPII